MLFPTKVLLTCSSCDHGFHTMTVSGNTVTVVCCSCGETGTFDEDRGDGKKMSDFLKNPSQDDTKPFWKFW